MTEKLFWSDPYETEFSATVVEQFPLGDGQAVVLDRTCFYATSGGQPYDLGTLNSLPVSDVRFEADRLIHIVPEPLPASSVRGTIDWKRRFDHMQQHTGQHILSAAFFQLFEAETSSFHLGDQYCSIELNRPNLNPDQVRRAEDLANSIVFSAQQVETFFVDPAKADEYPLRKKSDLQESLRIVKIADFDLSPCSGTHVRNSGEVGVLFITGTEKLSQTLKVSFLCGNRVVTQYHQDLAILKSLSKQMTTAAENLPESITKLQDQVKELRKQLSQLKEEQWKRDAAQMYETAQQWNETRRVVRVWKRPYAETRFIAQRLLEQPDSTGALVSIPDCRVVFFKHPKSHFDLRPVFERFLKKHGAKGGGPPHLMEAGGFAITEDFENQILKLWEE